MKSKTRRETLYEIAEPQSGYFSAAQVREQGISSYTLSRDVWEGRLERIDRGIYRLPMFPNMPYEDMQIALLRSGPNAVMGYESALQIFELSDFVPNKIHVIVPRSERYRSPIGTVLHTSTNLDYQKDVILWEGLRVTKPEKTINDVAAAGLSEEHIQKAVIEAVERGLCSREAIINYSDKRSEKVIRKALVNIQ